MLRCEVRLFSKTHHADLEGRQLFRKRDFDLNEGGKVCLDLQHVRVCKTRVSAHLHTMVKLHILYGSGSTYSFKRTYLLFVSEKALILENCSDSSQSVVLIL